MASILGCAASVAVLAAWKPTGPPTTAVQAGGSPAATLLPIPIVVNVDSRSLSAADPDALHMLLHAAPQDATAQASWIAWASLSARRAAVSIRAPISAPTDSLAAYAGSTGGSVGVALDNRAAAPEVIRLRVRLGEGAWSCDAIVAGQNGVRFRRFQGNELNRTSVLLKVITLDPGGLCIVRLHDQRRASRAAWIGLFQTLHRLAASKPAIAHRTELILQEARPFMDGLSTARSPETRVACAHRLLLILAQVLSMQHNEVAHHGEPSSLSHQLLIEMENLDHSVSGASAAILCLGAQAQPEASTTGDGSAIMVTVSLANGGSTTLHSVKLGIALDALPPGVTCLPAAPGYFNTLSPGQTASARFSLAGLENGVDGLQKTRAMVSYFYGSAAARLRFLVAPPK
ncbi:MAG: hypothetical protein KGJ62_00150 [Armatimonadetes bacterium]|nr:hypothetical protein [Armatimonadota bacterium]